MLGLPSLALRNLPKSSSSSALALSSSTGRLRRQYLLSSRAGYVSLKDIVFGEEDPSYTELIKSGNRNQQIKYYPISKKVNGKFISPWSSQTNKKLSDVMKLVLSPKRPRMTYPNDLKTPTLVKSVEVDREKIRDTTKPHFTWMGHASCYYQTDGVYFLTDPVWSSRASPFSFMGPKRYVPPPVNVEDLKVDVVLISHTHYDHLDLPTVRRIGNRAHWVVPLGVKKILANAGIHNCTELDWWGAYNHLTPKGINIEVTFVPTKHWTARTFFDRNTCLWGGYSVAGSQTKFFFTGDTAYSTVFETIGKHFGPFDIAAVPIGAYSPRWFMKDVHCNPEEAVKIHQDIRAKKSAAIHWGTFPLTEEDVIEPALELARVRDIHNMPHTSFFTMAHGETMYLHEEPVHDLAVTNDAVYGHYLQTLRSAPSLPN